MMMVLMLKVLKRSNCDVFEGEKKISTDERNIVNDDTVSVYICG